MKFIHLLGGFILTVSPFLAAQSLARPDNGTITSLEAGDVACYVEFSHDGMAHEAMASFDICEQTHLLHKKVSLSYSRQKVLADSCEGNPDCSQTETVWLIDEMTPI